GEPVAINIAPARNLTTPKITWCHPIQPEAIGAIQGRQIDRSRKTRCLAKHHIARFGSEVAPWRFDDHIAEASTVDIAGPSDPAAALVTGAHTIDPKAVCAVK